MTIYPVKGCSKITQYNNKRVISMENLVETMWMSRYPRQTEITYDQKSGFGHEFTKHLIETEYGITSKPSTSVNTNPNTILEWIHQVLGKPALTCNIIQTYVDKYDPWSGILAAAAFSIISTTYRLKRYSPGQLFLDMI